MMIAAPAIFIILADFIIRMSEKLREGKQQLAIKALILILIALPIRYSIERIKPLERSPEKKEWRIALQASIDALPADSKILVINEAQHIEAMFFFDCVAYDIIPKKKIHSKDQIQRI